MKKLATIILPLNGSFSAIKKAPPLRWRLLGLVAKRMALMPLSPDPVS
jgi:hypothetical protein